MLASTMPQNAQKFLILGIGNSLLSDDGFGIHVTNELRDKYQFDDNILIRDGGTIGLSLLPDIEDADNLIVVDAGQLNSDIGTLKTFFNDDMDDHLSRHKSTVHEVAIVDLLFAARLQGRLPKTRALVAVQPQSLEWGMQPTPKVQAAIDPACKKIIEIIGQGAQI
jgi:hydrogenase maturation protease